MKRIAVLVSGGGTNLQALIDAERDNRIPNGKIVLVVSSNENAYALRRAETAKIDTKICCKKDYSNNDEYSAALRDILLEAKTDLVIFAGFLTIVTETLTKAFPNRIINIHPALIPSFCGEGYWGVHVHEAVLESGVKLTGATVHFVNEKCDGGPIILQKAVEVKNDDTPETLQKRVMKECEWKLLPRAAALFCEDKIKVIGNKTVIDDN